MFSAKTEKGPVTPSIVSGWAENLDKFSAMLLTRILRYGVLHGEDKPAYACAEYDLDCPPRLTSQLVQITGKSDAGQEVCEEHVDSARQHKLVEETPIRYPPMSQIPQVFL